MEYAYEFLPHQLSNGSSGHQSSFPTDPETDIISGYVDSVLNHDSTVYYGNNYTYQQKQSTEDQSLMSSQLFHQPSYVYPVYNPYAYQQTPKQQEDIMYYPMPILNSVNENYLSQKASPMHPVSHHHHHRRHSLSSSMSSPSSCYSSISSFTSNVEERPVLKKSASLFRCTYEGCEKTFTRTYNLKSHLRTHTDQKPFQCSKCPKAFARQHDRNRHEKLHTGSKPYLCEFCHKSFARQDALNRHLKRDKRSVSRKQHDNLSPPCVSSKLRQKQLAMLKKKRNT